MSNPAFISVDDIRNIYIPMGFTNFKIEGRSLGSALILEFILYYMTKPEFQIHVREAIYLDNMLDFLKKKESTTMNTTDMNDTTTEEY